MNVLAEKAIGQANDAVVLNIEDVVDKQFIEARVVIPEKFCREYGPEIKDAFVDQVNTNPIELIHCLLGGGVDDVEWGDLEKESVSIGYEDKCLHVNLNFCGRLK